MLSRVAESIYWMSRYIERVESVARLVEVNLHLVLDASGDYGDQWGPLVNTAGDQILFAKRYEVENRENVMRFLTFDRENPNSILSCAWKARENARSIRDTISSEMWEQVNRFYAFLRGHIETDYAYINPHDFYTEVKMATHLFDGIADATMSHGDAWHFLRLGEMLERADKTSRILDVKYFILLPRWQGVGSTVDGIQWAALLKSASAFEMYRKRYKTISPAKVADFLVLNQEFPRSIRWCLDQANEALLGLGGGIVEEVPSINSVNLPLEALITELNSATIEEIIGHGLHEFLDVIQRKLIKVHEAVSGNFFVVTSIHDSTYGSTGVVSQ